MKRTLLAAGLALALAGCGGGASTDATDTTTTEPPAGTTALSVYFLLDGKVWPVLRQVEEGAAVATAALVELARGPTDEEQAELGFETAFDLDEPPEGDALAITDGVVRFEPSSPVALPEAGLAQLVYTLTQFATVDTVEIAGELYTRADFESLTPAVLVESPRFFEDVGNPARATGTANTFEATFQYELTDTDGRIVDEGFVTATSGSGERGTFDFTTDEYEIPFDGVGALFVFELSAEDGSRINLVEIPVRMSR